MQNLNKDKLREQFYEFCPGARENHLIADWWLNKFQAYQQALIEELEGKLIKNTIEPDDLAYIQGIDHAIAIIKDKK